MGGKRIAWRATATRYEDGTGSFRLSPGFDREDADDLANAAKGLYDGLNDPLHYTETGEPRA